MSYRGFSLLQGGVTNGGQAETKGRKSLKEQEGCHVGLHERFLCIPEALPLLNKHDYTIIMERQTQPNDTHAKVF